MGWPVSRLSAALLAVSMVLAGCGGGSSGEAYTPPPSDNLACQSLSIPTNADALSLASLSGLSDQLESLFFDESTGVYAVYSDEEGGAEPVYSPLIEDASGTIMLGVPILPDAPYETATRQVELVFGNVNCGGFEQTVSGISKGDPQWVDDFTSEYRAAIELRAAAIDPSLSDWADILTLKDEYVAGTATLSSNNLVFVLMLADSLETILTRAEGLSAEEKVLLASWMGQMGLVDGGGTSVTALRLPLAGGAGGGAGTSVQPFFTRIVPANEQMIAMDAAGGCSIVGEGGITITSAAELDDYMQQQKDAEELLSGLTGDLRQLGAASTPFIGFVSAGAGVVAGGALFLDTTYREYLVHLLPSRLDGLDFDISPGLRIPEDYELINSQNAFWSDARVNAHSRDWNLTGVALDLVVQSVGLANFLKGMGTVKGLETRVKSAIQDSTTNEVLNRLKSANPAAQCLSVPARTWAGIDITSDEWSRGNVGPEGILALGPRTTLAEVLSLLKTGTTEVFVETRPDKFGGRKAVGNKFVEVAPTRMSSQPPYKLVGNPGEAVSFRFNIADTVRPELTPAVSALSPGLSVISGPTYLGFNEYEIELSTPGDPDQYPASVTLSRNAVLDPMTPRTLDLTVLNREYIVVLPAEECARVGEPLELLATLEGFATGTEPGWRVVAGPGSVNGTGSTGGNTYGARYVSSLAGEATVEAYALASDGKEVVASAKVFVGACDAKVHVYHSLDVTARAPEESKDIFEFEGERIQLPDRPASFWSGRTEREGRSVYASGNLRFTDGGNSVLVFQETSGYGAGTWQVDGNGTTTFDLDFEATDQCDKDPTEQDSPVRCSHTNAIGSAAPLFYVDLNEARNYQLNMSVACDTTGDADASINFFAQLLRFDSSGTPLPTAQFETDQGQQYPGGLIFSIVREACSATEGGISYDEVIRLKAPTTGGMETVVLSIGLVVAAESRHYGDSSGVAVPGVYTGSATINASFEFFPVKP